MQAFLSEDGRQSPFDYAEVEYVRDARKSKQLNHMNAAAIIISANGMAEGGRILHHLKNNLEDAHNTVLLVSFMAENTLGRKLQDGEKRVHIYGDSYDVRASVERIDGYSAHADQQELLAWAAPLERTRLQQLFLVHGEPEAADTLASLLRAQGFVQVMCRSEDKRLSFDRGFSSLPSAAAVQRLRLCATGPLGNEFGHRFIPNNRYSRQQVRKGVWYEDNPGASYYDTQRWPSCWL